MVFCEKNLINEINHPNYKICIKDYHLIKVLGQGAFAKVVQVRHKVNGRIFAMKIISKDKIMMNLEDDGPNLTLEELAARNMYRVR